MNKTTVAQQAKTASSLPHAQGMLQRTCASCGNHTVAGGECAGCAKNKSGFQRKLAIGASNDPLEREADRVADQVMAAPAHLAVSGAPPRIQRFSGQSNVHMDTAPASVDRVFASSGRPLEPTLQQDMGQRFGHDFSGVRVHSGEAAEQSAREVNANAYTVENNIVFGAGRFAPGAYEGRRLIAHELTHVVQQSNAERNHGRQGNEKLSLSLSISPTILQKQDAGPAGAATAQSGSGPGLGTERLLSQGLFAKAAKEKANECLDFDKKVIAWINNKAEPFIQYTYKGTNSLGEATSSVVITSQKTWKKPSTWGELDVDINFTKIPLTASPEEFLYADEKPQQHVKLLARFIKYGDGWHVVGELVDWLDDHSIVRRSWEGLVKTSEITGEKRIEGFNTCEINITDLPKPKPEPEPAPPRRFEERKERKRMQAKLTIGASNDPLEQEADRVAEQVLAAPLNFAVGGAPLRIQRFSGQSNVQTDTAPASVDRVLASSGGPLESTLRQDMEHRFGHDFSRVRVHSGAAAGQSAREVNANAYTVGHDIVFSDGQFAPASHEGRRLIAHELTHVVQQSRTDGIRAGQDNEKHNLSPIYVVQQLCKGAALLPMLSRPDDAAEHEADSVARAMQAGARVQVNAAPSALIARQPQQSPAPPLAWGSGWFPSQGGLIPGQKPPVPPTMFEQPSAWTATGAPAAFDAFLMLAQDDRKKAFEISYPTGNLAKALAALGASNAQSKYADVVRDLARWAQEYATRKMSGKTDEALAETHGKWMEAQAVAAAKAATGTATPSTASIASAGTKIVASTAIAQPVPPKWDSPGFPQAKWTAAGQRAIDAMVKYATANHPSLGLKKDHFILAFKEVEEVSGAALAYHTAGPGGVSRVSIGYNFVKTVLMTDDLDKMLTTTPKPEYMIEVIVHELLGHQEFEGSDYAMSIYDAAAKHRPSYTRPADNTGERRDEQQSFGYHSTEIYAIMRGFDYKHPVAAADKVPGVLVLSNPKDEIARYVGLVAKEWEPSVGAAIMRGLYVRFKMDPRLSAAAVGALADAIRTHFALKAADILS